MTQKPAPTNVNAANLTDAQVAELRGALLGKRRELLSDLTQGTQALGEESSAEAELMDQAEAAVALDERAQRNTRDSALLAQIEDALQRLEVGSYGLSEESGEPIDFARLRAVPWARRSAQEEEERESRARAGG
jgi:DnaK suppressor protein